MALVVDVSSSRQILKPLAEEYRDLKEIRIRNGHTINDFMIQRITMNKIIKGVEEAINSHQSLIRASNVCLPNENQTILLLDNKSLEIEKAISLLTRFKDRFQNEEHIYNSFLNTLRSKTIEELHREVATNCQNHQDLLEEFEHFISPHSSFTRVSEGPSSLDSFLLHGGKGCVVPSKRPPWMLKAVKMCMRPEFNQNVDLNKLEYDKKKGHEMKKNKTKGRRHVIVDECDISKSNIITHSSVADKNTEFSWKEDYKIFTVKRKRTNKEKKKRSDEAKHNSAKKNDVKMEEKDTYLKCDSTDAADQNICSTSSKEKFDFNKSFSDLDLSKCHSCTPNYLLLPKEYMRPTKYRKCEIVASTLNDMCVLMPSANGRSSPRKKQITKSEEKLNQMEDNLYELDLLLSSIKKVISQVEDLLDKLKNNIVKTVLPFHLESYFTTANLRCIEQLYGAHGLNALDVLRKNIKCALPVILTRLKQKQEEWSRCRANIGTQ